MRHTAFTFTLQPTALQEVALRQHAGAARFAYNWGLATVIAALAAKQQQPSVKVPWSGFDLINAFNRWKVSAAAGADENGKPGLPWRQAVLQQVFEEGLVDLGRGLQNWNRARKNKSSRSTGFPTFHKKGQRDSFRMRNGSGGVRVGVDAVQLPKVGSLRVRESTRCVRRLMRPGPGGQPRARVLFATVCRNAGGWQLRLNVEAAAFHPAVAALKTGPECIGIDRGLHAFAVAATADGREQWRSLAPKPLGKHLKKLRRASRQMSRKHLHSHKRARARAQLGRLHQRIASIRRAHVHQLSTHVAQSHRHVVLEDLHIAGMLRNRCLARHIADSCWGLFARQMAYKGTWYGCRVTQVDRFAPTSKTCCQCSWKAARMPLDVRVFTCPQCGWEADRDVNAAANCARWAPVEPQVASKQEETLNARGDLGSGRAWRGETKVREAGRNDGVRGYAQLPTPEEGAVEHHGCVNRL